jgi:S-adenosylmethionine decarboxylase
MAFNDTLFQLGMDLTRSSTTQAEVLGSPASSSHEHHGVKFAGTHLIADLSGAKRLDDVTHIEKTLTRCVELAGGSLLHSHVHRFGPNGGVSGVVVLKEGHINVRTWPADGEVACDVFFMGSEEGADLIVDALAQGVRATGRQVTRHERRSVAPKSKTRRPRLVVRERAQAAA